MDRQIGGETATELTPIKPDTKQESEIPRLRPPVPENVNDNQGYFIDPSPFPHCFSTSLILNNENPVLNYEPAPLVVRHLRSARRRRKK